MGRTVSIESPVEGLIYRGRLVGYARGHEGERYAVVDTGRELVAFGTADTELAAGREVRATAHQSEADRRRQLIWRVGEDQREQQRDRA
jgi:hypothetical protein